ncbi:hypothetical protein GUITHDRAFT_161550 [Guillardia theta CCMP2712]|uniref:Uncharacterized protein n=1 Tax=Guillardia theta (strain CCMP2712) TaxID=905079 RepID=L1JT82_GUITC|nr:hypothetical protein GUITHDRAFT_161550 [Guillardia theta CCMP2712]EKX51529.1 hypothetical protein GUITHDRAFT_161550 [Guillardia theta CCMP2712]|eukprot:XP_005838509.1 hypothetical protein GUITHDRAFT_161550 [Guillardia theta CCMP2712]
MRKHSDMDVDFNWFADEDTPESLASRAFECNELLKVAVGQVEKDLLEAASAICGSKNMHPSSLEFELASKLATMDRPSQRKDPEKLLRIAQSQFEQSRLGEACSSLHCAVMVMEERERSLDTSLDSSVSLPGSSDAMSGNTKLSLNALQNMLVQTLTKSLLDAMNEKNVTQMKKAVENLCLLLPQLQVATTVGQQFWLKIKHLFDRQSLAEISSMCKTVEVDATNILDSFTSLHLKVTWKEIVEEATITPLCNFIAELVRGISFPLLMTTTQNLASSIFKASSDSGRLIDIQDVILSLWKQQRLWVRSKIVNLLSEQFRDLTMNDKLEAAEENKAESSDSIKGQIYEGPFDTPQGNQEEFALYCKRASPRCLNVVQSILSICPRHGLLPVEDYYLEFTKQLRCTVEPSLSPPFGCLTVAPPFRINLQAYLISLETSMAEAMHDGIKCAYRAAANTTLIHFALGMVDLELVYSPECLKSCRSQKKATTAKTAGRGRSKESR